MKQNWISCDICQTWYHQSCVGVSNFSYFTKEPKLTQFQITDSDNVEREFFCNKCTEADMDILNRLLSQTDYRLLNIAFTRLRQSKYAWPLISTHINIPICKLNSK